jgi:hypothetical protein
VAELLIAAELPVGDHRAGIVGTCVS